VAIVRQTFRREEAGTILRQPTEVSSTRDPCSNRHANKYPYLHEAFRGPRSARGWAMKKGGLAKLAESKPNYAVSILTPARKLTMLRGNPTSGSQLRKSILSASRIRISLAGRSEGPDRRPSTYSETFRKSSAQPLGHPLSSARGPTEARPAAQ
jgi:hypothetical protein